MGRFLKEALEEYNETSLSHGVMVPRATPDELNAAYNERAGEGERVAHCASRESSNSERARFAARAPVIHFFTL